MPKTTTRNRIARTLVQLVAAGGATEVVTEIVKLVPARMAPLTLAVCMLAVAAVHNFAEDMGWLQDRRR